MTQTGRIPHTLHATKPPQSIVPEACAGAPTQEGVLEPGENPNPVGITLPLPTPMPRTLVSGSTAVLVLWVRVRPRSSSWGAARPPEVPRSETRQDLPTRRPVFLHPFTLVPRRLRLLPHRPPGSPLAPASAPTPP